MKKYSLLIAGLLMLVAVPILIFAVQTRQELRQKAAPATTLSLIPANTTKKEGETFSLDIAIDTGPNQVVIAELHLTYDPAKLEAISITNGPLFSRIYASGVVGGGSASITVGASDELHPVKGTGSAAVIRFKALSRTDAPISVRLVPTTTFVGGLGEGSANLLTGSTPATITVIAGTGGGSSTITPTPTTSGRQSLQITTVTPTPTCTPRPACLDVAPPARRCLPPEPDGGWCPLGQKPNPTSTPTSAVTPTSAITPTTTVTPTSTAQQLKINTPTANTTVSAENLQISGKAKPGATVTITIYSDPITLTTTASESGDWSVTPTNLISGPHNIVVTATDTFGNSETASTSFILSSSSEAGIPVTGNISTTLILIFLGSGLLILGAIPLFR